MPKLTFKTWLTLEDAQRYIRELYEAGLMFHFDDGAVDCLHRNGVCTLSEAERIDVNIDHIYRSKFDWGEFGCPIGYALHLIERECA